MTDYISIIMLSKCFPTITMERLSEPLINAMLGILSQMLQVCFIMVLRRYVVKILGNAYHIRMGKIYNLSDLYNHCPDCTSDKF